MEQKPRSKNESIFAHGLGLRVILQGVLFALLTLIGYVVGEKTTGTVEGGQTMAFIILSMSQIVQALNMRTDRSLFRTNPFSNRTMNLAVVTSVLLTALLVFTPVGYLFGLVTLPAHLYLIALILLLLPLPIQEICKALGLIDR